MVWYLREHREATGTFSSWRKARVFVSYVFLVGRLVGLLEGSGRCGNTEGEAGQLKPEA